MATIHNTSATDFGCTSVEVDRSGSTGLPFNSYNLRRHLHSKTLKITPQYDETGSYDITMYYTPSELIGWENATNNTLIEGRLVKTSDTTISAVSPENVEDFIIDQSEVDIDTLGEAVTFNGAFSGGFSGFGFGNYCNLLVRSNSDSGVGSLRQCLACGIDGDTIHFASSINNEITITSSSLIIEENIFIQDNPLFPHTVNATSTIRAFEILNGVHATIKGLTIKSGTSAIGRGILNNGQLTILNVRIENHLLAGPGEILTNRGTLDIDGDCTIEK